MRHVLSIGAVVFACLAPTRALADAIPPPPADCPAGSVGSSCHGGEYCSPSPCPAPTDCADGYECESRQLCIGQLNCAGGWDPDAGPFYRDTVEGSCANGATCLNSSCQTVSVCVPSVGVAGGSATGAPGSTIIEQGCTCRTTGGRVGAGAALVAMVGAPLLLILRRPRRRPRS